MAKYERRFQGNFSEVLRFCEQTIEEGSTTISLEDQSNYTQGDTSVAVRVYERYSWTGSSRVSLSLTLVGANDELFVSLIASGGSQALVFKINTFGETAFLETISVPLEKYINKLP